MRYKSPQKQGKRNTQFKKQKNRLKIAGLIILILAFILVWVHICITGITVEKTAEKMVLGEDYFVEDVRILEKKRETGTSGNTEDYYFYYRHGSSSDQSNRMWVPGNIYSEYEVGDTISAYTTNHQIYSYHKEGILPTYTQNEAMKAVGVLLGLGIAALVLVGFVLG